VSAPPLDRLAARATGWAELAGRAGPVTVARHALEARAGGLDAAVFDAAYRRIWEQAAEALGAQVRSLGGGWLEIRRGDAVTRLRRNRVALDLARLLGGPEGAVVKPADGFSGRGVTCGVRTRAELGAAARRAAGYGTRVLVERTVRGDNLRLLLCDGELLDVIVRRPPPAARRT